MTEFSELLFNKLKHLEYYTDALFTHEGGRGVPDNERTELFRAIRTAMSYTQDPNLNKDDRVLGGHVLDALKPLPRIYELSPSLHHNPTVEGRTAYDASRYVLQTIGEELFGKMSIQDPPFTHPLFTEMHARLKEVFDDIASVFEIYREKGPRFKPEAITLNTFLLARDDIIDHVGEILDIHHPKDIRELRQQILINVMEEMESFAPKKLKQRMHAGEKLADPSYYQDIKQGWDKVRVSLEKLTASALDSMEPSAARDSVEQAYNYAAVIRARRSPDGSERALRQRLMSVAAYAQQQADMGNEDIPFNDASPALRAAAAELENRLEEFRTVPKLQLFHLEKLKECMVRITAYNRAQVEHTKYLEIAADTQHDSFYQRLDVVNRALNEAILREQDRGK